REAGWSPLKVASLKLFDRFTARLVKPDFVACSEFVRRSFLQYFGMDERSIRVIYNSVDPVPLEAGEDEAGKLKKELLPRDDGFVYLTVGRLDSQKNHKTLFEAFRLLLPEAPNAYLMIAGVGGLEDELKSLACGMGLEERILFLGRRSDIGALLA